MFWSLRALLEMGLRYLGRHARRLIAGDYTESMLRVAKKENLRVPRIRLDAQKRGPCWFGTLQKLLSELPKPSESFGRSPY